MARKQIRKKLKTKYRVAIYNDTNFAEIFSLKLSLISSYIIIGGISLIIFVLGILLVTYTPVKQYIYATDYKTKAQTYKNALIIDSLQDILAANEKQYARIQLVMTGNANALAKEQNPRTQKLERQQNKDNKQINYMRAAADSKLREMVESEDRFNVMHGAASRKETFLNLYLYPPVKGGIIIASYQNNIGENFGLDISTKENSHIMATAKGTVISANWSVEDGYKIIIQHDNELISCYKHNSKLLKKVGEQVNRGEAIAIIGTKTANSATPVLHFELWQKGISIDPQDFISF